MWKHQRTKDQVTDNEMLQCQDADTALRPRGCTPLTALSDHGRRPSAECRAAGAADASRGSGRSGDPTAMLKSTSSSPRGRARPGHVLCSLRPGTRRTAFPATTSSGR